MDVPQRQDILGKQRCSTASQQCLVAISYNFTNVSFYDLFIYCDETA